MRVMTSLFMERVKSSFWVLPAVMAVAIVLALLWLQSIEVQSESSLLNSLLLYDASPQGARLILSSIATAVMTVVGVLFSITIVVLQQVSSQYSPRVIQIFVRSTPSQLVLGFYLGTFSYCLLLLRKIHDKDAAVDIKIPQLAMSFGIVLSIICLCLLIYYVHHITSSIQSTHIISRLTRDTLTSFQNIVSDRADHPRKTGHPEFCFSSEVVIHTREYGYLQAIEWKRFKRLLNQETCHVEILRQPGEYLQKGVPLVRILSKSRWNERKQRELLRHFSIGESRTHAQDPKFGVRQLVDIALRALSPGINDPTTAMEAMNGIGAILLSFTEHHPIQSELQLDSISIIDLSMIDADHFVGLCFDQLIQFGSSHLPVLRLIFDTLNLAEKRCTEPQLGSALVARRHATNRALSSLERQFPSARKQAV